MKVNYDLKMEEILKDELEEIKKSGKKKRLLIHSCCGPCSSSVLEYLKDYFKMDIFYYNPNITFEEEYYFRKEEQKEMIRKLNYDIDVIDADYDPQKDFFDKIKGLENEPERGKRCFACYDLRIRETAKKAKEDGYDYFSTVLSISPMKNAAWINEIGDKYSHVNDIPFLFGDFKKKNRYLRSIQISKELGMYRQEYCGCVYSKEEREKYEEAKRLREEQEQNKVG